MKNIPNLFGSLVFNDSVMKARLPKETYKALKNTIQAGKSLDLEVANVVANAMKDWAIEKGATHFTHWFQPMTGITAEKHDSFISPDSNGRIIMEFSGKELIKGEPDASSFPSGGLRATFEARGYTAWDPTSPAFVKDGSLYIPTAFCSYTGEILDKKTPLLRSMDVISEQAIRVLRLFGNTTATRVTTTVGPEQEYFLIDKQLYNRRKDLRMTGRTLFGAKPPRGQELDDHYFGAIKPRVAAYMKDLDETLWALGIPSKTKHNEVAPSQHEMAPIYTDANTACDQNQLVMEMMKKVADRHGLVCLLHEKPFAGVNGSGKHDNWSLGTDTGRNLFKPGSTPSQNARFLLFLAAFIKGVDEYQDFLRTTVATAGNDHRLGAQEAPPAVLSIFLGDELNAVVESIIHDTHYTDAKKKMLKVGVDVLPAIRQDNTDRNRTSPMAFTGNKFEFRMLGSSQSISGPNIALNTIMAEELKQFADALEASEDFRSELPELIRQAFTDHRRIIFNGNGYDGAWIKEAVEKRGLLNYPATPDCVPHLLDGKNVALLTSHGVLTKAELVSRYEVTLENYCKTIRIEANTMVDMARTEIIPAVQAFVLDAARTAAAKRELVPGCPCGCETELVKKLSALTDEIYREAGALEEAVLALASAGDIRAEAEMIRDTVLPQMGRLRLPCDQAETLTPKKYWPFPTYGDLLFGVR